MDEIRGTRDRLEARGIIRDTTDKLHSSDVNILKDALTDPQVNPDF